jgi:hypothetical protein
VAAAAKEQGAASFGSSVLRLAPLVKEHYFDFVAATFPDLLPRYERAYAGTNISSDYQTAIERRVGHVREQYGFAEDAMQSRRGEAAGSMRAARSVTIGSGQLALPL